MVDADPIKPGPAGRSAHCGRESSVSPVRPVWLLEVPEPKAQPAGEQPEELRQQVARELNAQASRLVALPPARTQPVLLSEVLQSWAAQPAMASEPRAHDVFHQAAVAMALRLVAPAALLVQPLAAVRPPQPDRTRKRELPLCVFLRARSSRENFPLA